MTLIRTVGDLHDAVEDIRQLRMQVMAQERFLEVQGPTMSLEQRKVEQRRLLDMYAQLRIAREEKIE